MATPATRRWRARPGCARRRRRTVLRALAAGGRPVRFVGGCVRDGLLGRVPPGGELDLATPELPDQVMRRLEAAGLRAIPTGLAHGTVSTIVDGQRFEITTLRQDVACDGRHAEVVFTEDFAADAARRDLTINAMSCDGDGPAVRLFRRPRRSRRGPGALRRARRRTGSPRTTCASCASSASSRTTAGRPRMTRRWRPRAAAAAELARLSGERIQAEMLRLLAADDPLPALRLMAEAGVLAAGRAGRGRARAPGRPAGGGARTPIRSCASPRCCARRPAAAAMPPGRSPPAGGSPAGTRSASKP